MSIIPEVDFTDSLWLDDTTGSINLIATHPLSYNNHVISCAPASGAAGGYITNTPQIIAGVKTFSDSPLCGVVPSEPNNLTNKQYVDNLVSYSQAWQEPIECVIDLSLGPPAGIAISKRYIASVTAGGFTAGYIYSCLTVTPLTYQETQPAEGWCLYDREEDENLIYASSHIWIHLGLTLDHVDLKNKGTLTHAQIDGYLDQNVKVAASPQFARIGVGLPPDAAPLGPKIQTDGIIATTNITESVGPNSGALVVSGGASVGKTLTCKALKTNTIISYTASANSGHWNELFVPSTTAATGRLTFFTFEGVGSGLNQEIVLQFAQTNLTFSGRMCAKIFPTSTSNLVTVRAYTWPGDGGLIHVFFKGSIRTVQYLPNIGILEVDLINRSSVGGLPNNVPNDAALLYDSNNTDWVESFDDLSNNFGMDRLGDFYINAYGNDIRFHSSDAVRVLNTTAPNSSTSGALVVSGGMGVANAIYTRTLTNLCFYATWKSTIHADCCGQCAHGSQWVNATTEPAIGLPNCPSILYRNLINQEKYLDLRTIAGPQGAPRYVSYNSAHNLEGLTNNFTISVIYNPVLATPATNQVFLSTGNLGAVTQNMILFYHTMTTGFFHIKVNDSNGNSIIDSDLGAAYLSSDGAAYLTVEFAAGTAPDPSIARLYLNGVLSATVTGTTGATRTQLADYSLMYVGADINNPTEPNNFPNMYLRHLVIWKELRHNGSNFPRYMDNANGLVTSGSIMSYGQIVGTSVSSFLTPTEDFDCVRLMDFSSSSTLSTCSPTFSNTIAQSVTAPQFSVKYDGTNKADFSVSSGGDITIDASGNDINLHSSDTVRVLNTNDAVSNSAGGALIVSGGISAAKRICSKAMTCDDAPVSDTDVVRKVDMETIVPPLVESLVPPLVEAAVPPLVETAVPPLVESLVPPLVESLVPPLVETAVPPLVETAVPPLVEAAVPPLVETLVPPLVESLVPPLVEAAVPPLVEAAVPPLVETLVPPIVETIVPDLPVLRPGQIVMTAPDLNTSNAFFIASMAISLFPEIATVPAYTTSGTPTITNGKLVMSAQDEVKYNGSNFDKTSMTVKLMYRPNYDNSPTGPQILFKLVTGATWFNAIYLFHAANGNLSLAVHNITGDKMIEFLEPWGPTSGKDYEIEFALGTSGSITSCYLFIDGILKKSAMQAAFTRQAASECFIGDSSNYNTNFTIWDIVAFPSVLHTASYIPEGEPSGYSLHGIINKRLTSLNTVRVADNLNVYGASHFHGTVTFDILPTISSETTLDQTFEWGPWDKENLPDPGVWYLTKIGYKVFLSAPQFIMASTVAVDGAYILMGVDIPSSYRPKSAIAFPITVLNNGLKDAGQIDISTAGVMYIRPGIYGTSNFQENAQDVGYFTFNISWDTRV